MEDRVETSSPHGLAPMSLPESTSAPGFVISSDVDSEIRRLREPHDAKSTTVVEGLNGGSHELGSKLPDPLVVLPDNPPAREYFKMLSNWRGRVLEVNGSTFRAILSSVAATELEKEADIKVSEVDDEDRHLIKEGAYFYWSVGYLNRPWGRVRASVIRFSRVPPISSRDVTRAKERARHLWRIFNTTRGQ